MNISKAELALAETLANDGLEFDLELSDNLCDLISKYPATPFLGLATANALTWTGHARDMDEYYSGALDYLTTGSEDSLNSAVQYFGRLGEDRLSDALKGWKLLLTHVDNDHMLTGNAAIISKTQNKLLRHAKKYKSNSELRGIGPWLFCAPFKILLINRKDLWDQREADDIFMPLGLEVNRGIRKLIRKKYRCTEDISEAMFTDDEGDLFEGMGTISLVQKMSRNLSDAVSSRVLHINSGLYLHGGDKTL